MKGIDKRTHKDGTVSYRARVRIKGHPVLIQSFASKILAMKWKRDTESAIERGSFTYEKPGSKHTLSELIDRYIERVLPTKPKNARNVRQHLLWWKQELGSYLLSDIKPNLISQKRDELLASLTCKNRPRSPTTVVRYLASLSHAFSVAVRDWEWMQENPTLKISKPKISNERTRFLNDDEKERLLSACRESESKGLYSIVILALSTGMRRGEIMNLKWSNIDLARGSIFLQTTKNGDRRFVPLVGMALDLLRSKYTNVQALKTGRFPKNELEKFVDGLPSLVDQFLNDSDSSLEDNQEDNLQASNNCLSENELILEDDFPIVETKDILSALNSKLFSNLDNEAIDFFIKEAVAKIWQHTFSNETEAVRQLEQYNNTGAYPQEVKKLFLSDYVGAKELQIPSGYNFKVNGEISLPNLMQRFTAYIVKSRRRLGNWSGTGAGKTLSAILSSRVIDAHFTLIFCPNNVVSGWKNKIETIYPDSIIFIKDIKTSIPPNTHAYLILNYEFFQQPQSESKLKDLIERQKIDFIVIDEIHYSKQRIVEDMSKRKKVISALLSEAADKNDNLHVLGMSATPVINNLFEGKTLIELITGFIHDDLHTTPSVGNCIALYQKLVSTGIRWLPHYQQKIDVKTIEVDCSSHLEQIKNISLQGSMFDLEAVLTQVKIPIILENLQPKTIVYTHYLKDIVIPLKEAIENHGWKTAIFSGDDKSGLEEFIKFDADILIASSCLGTGIDGLQHVCNRIIINTLPWTHAEFEQLKGRIYRQGQKSDYIDIIVPLTYASINGERWSWCDSRWNRILFKKSIADAAVDGIIPEGHLRTPAQAYQDTMNWLKRLEEGDLHEIERRKIDLRLSDEVIPKGVRKFGDFSKMNHQLNSTNSAITHKRFQKSPEDWEYYHAMYREARKEWTIIPYQEAIKWCKARPHLVIGDFGCGEALLAKEVENKIYSFDHIAINEDVTPCDIAHVPLDDDSLDGAIFSLSLMGTNYLDYIKEAHRCLKLDGHLWIAEATSRF